MRARPRRFLRFALSKARHWLKRHLPSYGREDFADGTVAHGLSFGRRLAIGFTWAPPLRKPAPGWHRSSFYEEGR